MGNKNSYDIFYIIYLMDIYADIKNGVLNEIDYLTDKNSPLVLGNEYKHQLDDVDDDLKKMVEKDVEEALNDDITLFSNFQKRELLRKKFYEELGITYKTLMEYFPDIRFF